VYRTTIIYRCFTSCLIVTVVSAHASSVRTDFHVMTPPRLVGTFPVRGCDREPLACSPSVHPLEFPKPDIHPASFLSVRAMDVQQGRLHNVTILRRSGEAQRGYTMRRKIAPTTYGSMHVCSVLHRRHGSEALVADWTLSDDCVLVKCSSWSKIRRKKAHYIKDPWKGKERVVSVRTCGRHDKTLIAGFLHLGRSCLSSIGWQLSSEHLWLSGSVAGRHVSLFGAAVSSWPQFGCLASSD
jgi:hypothetical protein